MQTSAVFPPKTTRKSPTQTLFGKVLAAALLTLLSALANTTGGAPQCFAQDAAPATGAGAGARAVEIPVAPQPATGGAGARAVPVEIPPVAAPEAPAGGGTAATVRPAPVAPAPAPAAPAAPAAVAPVPDEIVLTGNEDIHSLWVIVADATEKRLPKTALAALGKIITTAGAAGDNDALLRASVLEADALGAAGAQNPRATQIRALRSRLETAPPAVRPLLAAALARVWQAYYNENRSTLLRRSATVSEDTDFLTWDASRVRAEIAALLALALSDAPALKAVPVTAFPRSLTTGAAERPDTYRPTLFDFVAADAIEFHSLGEQGGAQSEEHFELNADSPLLGGVEEFLKWTPRAPAASPDATVIALYQRLLRFHIGETKNYLAAADADRRRILWARDALGNAAEARERVEKALRAHIERWRAYEPSADAAADLARLLLARPNDAAGALEAFKSASLGTALHPQSPGADACREVIATLQRRALVSLAGEFVSPRSVTVRAQNLDTVFLRVVRADWSAYLAATHNRPHELNTAELDELLRREPAKAWAANLPRAPYIEAPHRVAVPDGLAPGFYFVIASSTEKFSTRASDIAVMPFWVSDLALVFANRHGARRGLLGGETETAAGGGFVTRAGSGEPVAGAKVAVWRRERDSVERVKVAETVTGADGAFALKRGIGWGTDVLHVTAPDGQQLSSDRAHPGHVAGAPPPDRTRYHAHFLTDRAIYRPGQTIHFKVVVFTANRDTSEYRPAAGRRLTVGLLDPNGKDAATLSLTTNGFGAAHGTFTVPAGRLTGYYQLHSLGAENGRAGLRVEEYKRPKFEVALNAPVAAPKLGGSVTLAGSARQYTGAAVDTARVRWTVRRLTRWPDWCWWRPAGAGAGTARQIARGETRTAADGSFLVTFNAAPDKTADPKTEPRFHYEVSAEVTDAAGETRAVSRTVVAGYAAVAAEVTAGGWQSPAAPVAFTVRTFSLDGEPRPLAGNLVIYSLKQPERALRKPLGSEDAYDYGGGDADPDAPTGGEPRHWAELDGVASQRFTTNEKGVATLALKLDAGVYRAVVTARDAAGAPVTARAEVTVADPAAAQSVSREPFALEVRRDTLRPGDTFAAVWRSGHETARARVEIVHRGKTLAAFWTEPGRTQQLVTLPVTDALRGGFSVRVWQVAENRFYESARAIRVPWDDKRLDIAWERFNSKLTPGGRETWTLRVRNPDGSPAAAEIAAALYDASLDAFAGANTWRAIGDTGIFYDESRLWFGRLAFANGIQSGRRLYDKHPNATADSFSKQTYPACYRHWAAEIAGTWESWRPKWEMRDRRVNMVSAFDSRSVSAPRAAAPAFARVKESAVAAAGAADAQIATSQLQSSPDATGGAGAAAAGAVVALDQISARQNLRETAFFFPALIAEPDGGARLEFTAPEALTRWRFLAFAHDRQLRSGAFADASIVTAKDFMVQPDAPRFIREGDTLEIAVRLTNKGDAPLAGRVRLNFADAATLDPADAALGNTAPEREFTLPARSSRALSWRVRVPDGRGWLTYKAVGAAGLLSDGEEGFLPVLPRRQLVTDTLTFAVPSAAAETGTAGSAAVLRPVTRDFAPLLESADPARQIRHEALTVSVVSNPAWYAVMALPVLMEPGRREWSDELFHRLYANSLAARIAGADPRIERVFAQWRNTPALDSPLAKNTDLKSVLLEETPWVRDAEGESASRRRVGILFDKSRIAAEVAAALNDLMQRQRPDGFWPWCPGGDLSEHTTRRIVAGFGKLRAAAGERNAAIPRFLQRAIAALDAALVRSHLTALAAAKQRGADASREDHIGPAEAFHLYARSFFPPSGGTGGGTSAEVRAALDFYREQARVYWPTLPLLSQCHVALALHRTGTTAGQREAAAGIVRSLRERARLDPEQGMWWPPAAREGWLWRNAPLETQAAAIEVFNEVAADAPAVAALQRWLISQKQVRAWSTASATADAVYALLLPPPAGARVSDPIQERGSPTRPANAATGAAFPLLAAGTLPTVTLGGAAITPRNVEAGTGYYSERIAGALVKPTLGHISVTRPDAGVSWASVAWQYFQPLGQIRAAAATPLTIRKTLWKRVRTATGDTLVPVTGTAAAGANSAAATTTAKTGAPAGNAPLALGDTLVVRVEIRADRDMEFIHLKDQRPSGCEPVNVLSGHHYRSGLGYYESVRDTASHFFIAHLPAGTHVFEYDMRVRNRGLFQSGVAEIQSAYAPAFASRSASTPLRVE